MKAVVVGLGSMGKRRVRCLKELGVEIVAGFDTRADRRSEAETKYGIKTVASADVALLKQADVVVISTPPDKHTPYIEMAIEAGKPCFVEASVMLSNLEALDQRARERGVVVFPSCTMRYFEGPKQVRELVRSRAAGNPLSFMYQSAQYLPDWHPWEKVSEFYVSNADTGACREIVPFELAWLTWVFGDVKSAKALSAQKDNFGRGVEDIYQVLLQFESGVMGMMQVDVLDRHGTRRFALMTDNGRAIWDQYEAGGPVLAVEVKGAEKRVVNLREDSKTKIGINSDKPYIDEISDFLAAARGEKKVEYTLGDDVRVLKVLEAIRRDAGTL